MKIIYKGFNERDFNLTWTTPALGKVGNDIPKDQEKDAVDFMIIGEKGASRLSNAVTVLENLVIAKEMQKNN